VICARDWSGRVSHVRDETVSALGDGLDEPGLPGVIVENFSQLEYVGAQDLWLDVGLGPEGIEQLVMGDESAGVFDEIAQNRERLAGEGDLYTLVPEALVCSVQRERLKFLHACGTPGELNSTSRAAIVLPKVKGPCLCDDDHPSRRMVACEPSSANERSFADIGVLMRTVLEVLTLAEPGIRRWKLRRIPG
jgi:hypothetical protein